MCSQFLKTLYLIVRVTPPYQQQGTGDKKLLILGDSTGYGTGARRSSESIAGLIGSTFPAVSIINKSVNGRTAGELLKEVTRSQGSYDCILLQIGANDLLQGLAPSLIVETIEKISKELQVSSNQILVMTSGNIGAASRFSGVKRQTLTAAFRSFDQLMRGKSFETSNFTFVSLFTEPEHDPFILRPETYISIDGLHPTSAGYELWFQKLKPVLETTVR